MPFQGVRFGRKQGWKLICRCFEVGVHEILLGRLEKLFGARIGEP